MLSFGLQSRSSPTLHDQVTPHKVALQVVVQEFWGVTFRQDDRLPLVDAQNAYTEREERDLMFTLLQLVQSPDMELKDLMNKLQLITKPMLMDNIVQRLKELNSESIQAFMDLFMSRDGMPETPMQKSSFLGLFWRRMNLLFDRLSFNQVTQLQAKYKLYFEAWCPPAPNRNRASDAFTCSMFDTTEDTSMNIMDIMGETPRNVGRNVSLQGLSEAEKGKYSRRQAEYFIARQAALLQHNEHEALSPKKLQEKVIELLSSDPDLAEAHYLSYMNSLRMFEYCGALDSLYHYFDRQISINDPPPTPPSVTATKPKPEEDVMSRSYRYAALNMAALHYRFGHRAEALAAVQGAISLAQEANDHVCLQHALFWLQRLGVQGNSNSAYLLEKLVSKSGDLNLAYLTSLGVQAFAQHNALSTAKPATVFEYLLRSDIVNCQNSLSDLMCVSYSQKAALWALYGNREMCSLSSQLMLNLNTEDLGVYHNGELECLGLCHLAKLHAQQGLYSVAQEILGSARQRFPINSQHSHLWMLYEQQLNFECAFLSTKYSTAEQAVIHMAAVNDMEARYHKCVLLKERGDVVKALESVQHMIKISQQETKLELEAPDFLVRLLLLQGELFCCTNNPTEACQPFLSALTHAKQHNLALMIAMATLHLSYVQLCMDMPQQALTLLEGVLVTVICNGSLLDRAKAQYLWIRCSVAAANKKGKKHKIKAMRTAVDLLDDVIRWCRQLEAHRRTKDVIYYRARLYNELDAVPERNKCALEFRQLDEQYPTWNKSAVLIL